MGVKLKVFMKHFVKTVDFFMLTSTLDLNTSSSIFSPQYHFAIMST